VSIKIPVGGKMSE